MAQLERDIIRERVKGVLRKANEQGKTLGMPKVIVDISLIKEMQLTGLSVWQIAIEMGISKSSISRLLSAI